MLLPKDQHGCPFLILAPMEGVGDECFRAAMRSVGGFDEAVRDFLRVPKNAHVKSLAKEYLASEMDPIPMTCQLMGSDPDLMAEMAVEIESKGAKRIDLNCGCPSNVVTGRGAGSSLLKDPSSIYEVANAMVKAVSIPVTIKMRSGYEDTTLFDENIKSAEESGVKFITLHPRTKVDGYGPPAKWEFIARAKSLLKIPLVGNGDIKSVSDALRMLSETKCDALMIGRESIINPFIFHQIKASFANTSFVPTWDKLTDYFSLYLEKIPKEIGERGKINKMKQLLGFFFQSNPSLQAVRSEMLTLQTTSLQEFLSSAMTHLKNLWTSPNS